jgi:hypothetical protein
LTERELDLMAQAGVAPEMPPELIEAQGEYKIEYTSPMRRAMKSGDGIAITRTLEAAAALAQFDPSALDPFNIPKAMRKLADVHGFPAEDMRSPEEEKALKEGRNDQAEAAQLLEAAPVVSDVAANLTRMQQAGGRPQI